jgi:hypothetical protein
MPETRVIRSAQELRITPAEHKAALEVREMFAKNKFHHDPDLIVEEPNGFNMNVAHDEGSEGSCGTTACIGGWMFAAMRRDRVAPCVTAHHYVANLCSPALVPLFYPFCDQKRRDIPDEDGKSYDFDYELIPPEFALKAMDNFLATGNPNWPEATGACSTSSSILPAPSRLLECKRT